MNLRYCFELRESPFPDPCFAYFDTPDHLADILFDHEHVCVTVEGEYGPESDPYRIILCRIPQDQCTAFLKCIDLLPAFMSYAGHDDYEEYCLAVISDFRQKTGAEASGEFAPLQ